MSIKPAIENQSENAIQQKIVMWYRNNYCLAHHSPRCIIAAVPNGGNVSIQNRITLLATGMMPGFSDLILIHHKNISEHPIIYFVEVKTEDGIISKAQFNFMNQIKLLGMDYVLVRSLKSFQDFIYGL